MTLFLDTPRADGGLNHRFFVTSPNDCDEATIREYAQKARENVIGMDYLAASRTVQQVSRGQVRDGSELLVLSGISTKDPNLDNMLLKRLNEMLNLILNEPIPVGTPSVGMLVANTQIEGFEREFLKDYPVVLEPTSSPGRKRFGFMRILLIVSVVAIAVFFPLLVKSLVGKGNGGPDKGTTKHTQESENQGTGQAPNNTKEWEFLKDDENWKNLAEVTGLKSNWTDIDAVAWASNLIREADPTELDLSGDVTPDEFKNNKNVTTLLSAVDSKNFMSNDPDSISRKWLEIRSPDGSELLLFWDALGYFNINRKVSAVALKNLLRAWEQAIQTQSLSSEKSADARHKSQQKHPIEIRILVENDLTLFYKIDQFFKTKKFTYAVSAPTEWASMEWKKRLVHIRGAPQMSDESEALRKGIIGPLNTNVSSPEKK